MHIAASFCYQKVLVARESIETRVGKKCHSSATLADATHQCVENILPMLYVTLVELLAKPVQLVFWVVTFPRWVLGDVLVNFRGVLSEVHAFAEQAIRAQPWIQTLEQNVIIVPGLGPMK